MNPGALRVEVRPPWAFRLPQWGGRDGLMRVRGGVVHRLLHFGEEPVQIRVAQPARERVLFEAHARDRDAAAWGIERMRLALGVDRDLRPFYERFRFDPLIGRSVRSQPWLRVIGRPTPFEAFAWAVCEQLIESERAVEIQRRLAVRLARSCVRTGLRDAPTADVVAAQAPALLASLGLSESRANMLVRASREIAAGRIDLDDSDHERAWRALRALPGIGSWTVQMLALTGQGRLDQLPAGDLKFLKFAGRVLHGHPRARASEQEVGDLFAPYAPWAGLAGMHALRSTGGYWSVNSNSIVSHGASSSARRIASSLS